MPPEENQLRNNSNVRTFIFWVLVFKPNFHFYKASQAQIITYGLCRGLSLANFMGQKEVAKVESFIIQIFDLAS